MVSRRYCSVPQCKSYSTKEISLHYFPNKPNLRKQWQIALRIGKNISKYMTVCSKHFKECDFRNNFAHTKKRNLKQGVIPSQNLPIRSFERKLPIPRRVRNKEECSFKSIEPSLSQQPERNSVVHIEETFQQFESTDEGTSSVFLRDLNLLADVCGKEQKIFKNPEVQEKLFKNSEVQCNILNPKPIELVLQKSDETFTIFTGIYIELFRTLVCCVNNILDENEELIISDVPTKILICLIRMKLNIPFRVMAGMFSLHRTTLKKSFELMLPILRAAVEPVIYWPTIEENKKNMPACFKKYSRTRVVLDCTEIPVQSPNCLKCRTRTYSYYKCKHTFKYLIGVTPAGTISYISPGYGGRTSDKAIFLDSGLINKLEPHIDAVMVDKGFHIEKELMDHGIKLIRPPFLKSKSQLTKTQAEQTAEIARARIHVERVIQRLKIFKILTEKIAWSIAPHIDDAIVIIAAITNLSNPIFKSETLS